MPLRFRLLGATAIAACALAACTDPIAPDDGAGYVLLFERAPTPTLNQSNLFILEHAGAPPVPFFPAGTDPVAAQPRASADGRWVAFMALQPGTTQDAVWIARTDGTGRRQVFTSDSPLARPAPSPDGSRIAFVQYDAAMTSSRIWVVNADGTGARLVTNAEHAAPFIYTAPSWAPDGTRLVFAMGVPGNLGIATMLVAGGPITAVTQPPSGTHTEPAFSPDGQAIAYVRTTSPAQADILVLDVGTATTRTIYTGNGRSPAWSPDGGAIALSARVDGGPGDLYLVSSGAGAPMRLTASEVDDRYPNWVSTAP